MLLKYILLSCTVISLVACTTRNPDKLACVEVDTLNTSEACFAASASKSPTTKNQFPNPVFVNNPVHLRMKIGAVDAQLVFLDATVDTKVTTLGGQLVENYSVGTVQSSASYQDVPVWVPSNDIAAGNYLLEVAFDLGACGKRTYCVTNKTVVIK